MSLIPPDLMDALTDEGLVAVARRSGLDDIVVRLHDGDAPAGDLLVRRLAGAPTPKVVERVAAEHRRSRRTSGLGLLLVCDRVTAGAAAQAQRAGISLAAAEPRRRNGGDVALRLHDRPSAGRPPEGAAPREARSLRVPWALFQVLRCRVLFGALPQRDVAAMAGLTQARVSQASVALALDDAGRESLVDRWLEDFPGPGGVTTYWYGLASPAAQAATVTELLRGSGAREIAVSGDAAADLLAPWASPRRAVVHTTDGADLSAAGLVPARREESTLELVVPADPALFAVARRFWSGTPLAAASPVPLADPLQVLHDVRRSPSPDRDQAEQALRDRLRGMLAEGEA